MGERDIRYEFADFAVYPPRLCLFYYKTMVNNINNFGVINFYENKPSKQQKEPAPQQQESFSLPIPREGDYNGVRLYIEERRKFDEQFKDYCLHHNRKELCTFLSQEFGWFVDDKSLGKNISRNI